MERVIEGEFVKRRVNRARVAALTYALSLLLALTGHNMWAQTGSSGSQDRAMRLQSIARRVNRLESIKAVERLQYIYGYYQDRFLFNEVVTLFADQGAEAHYMGGVWVGQAGLRRLWLGYFSSAYSNGTNGPVAGRMFDMPQWQGVVDVSPDGTTAQGRFRTLGKLAFYKEKEQWISGVYENDYVKEDGKWKIKTFRFCSPWSAVYTEGWQDVDAEKLAPKWKLYPQDPNGPDRLETDAERCTDQYPHPGLVPFHFSNPVTGKREDGITAPPVPLHPTATDDGEATAPVIADLKHRIGVVNDTDELERFHNAYGFQQDYLLFNDQADLFADGPGVEVHFQYGVWEGKEGARRLWIGHWGGFSKYAEMPIFGVMIDHHQAQPVIDIAPDRQSARMRVRTSADEVDQYASVMKDPQSSTGANQSVIYENDYVKEEGKWKLKVFRLCVYGQGTIGGGYADLPVPGRLGVPNLSKKDASLATPILETQIVDAPIHGENSPSLLQDVPEKSMELYPANTIGPNRIETPEQYGCFVAKDQVMIHSELMPFHFPNPVTGKPVVWKNK
jgi:SnoaL-like domain